MRQFLFDMRLTLSTNYVIPAVLLNPILFLHSLNALLSRLLPPIVIDGSIQPPAYYPLGPSAQHPHVNMHANDNLCWSYTLVMVFAQLVAFGRISRKREEMRERDAQRQSKVALRGGIIRQFSDREIPLEREAYSTDEDAENTKNSGKAEGVVKPTDLGNGRPKELNGHALRPHPHQQTNLA